MAQKASFSHAIGSCDSCKRTEVQSDIIVSLYINNIRRLLSKQQQIIPVEINQLCFQYYYSLSIDMNDILCAGISVTQQLFFLNNPDIIDLLISMTYSALNAGRINLFFPTSVRGLDTDTQNQSFLLSPSGTTIPTEDEMKKFDAEKFANSEQGQPKPNITLLKQVIDLCPSVEKMQIWAKKGDDIFKKELTKIHCLLYPLLVWIVTSTQYHLCRLSKDHQIKAAETEYQFALCVHGVTPDREKEFQHLRATNGSFLAWHGAAIGNWHNILRIGLTNPLQKKKSAVGAAYGNGLYFAKNFSLCWGYCRPGSNSGWKKSKFGKQISCMALCEICYHADDAKNHWKQNRWAKTSGIYVVDQEKYIMTRMILIFAKTSGYKSLDANSLMGSLPNYT